MESKLKSTKLSSSRPFNICAQPSWIGRRAGKHDYNIVFRNEIMRKAKVIKSI